MFSTKRERLYIATRSISDQRDIARKITFNIDRDVTPGDKRSVFLNEIRIAVGK